MIKDYTRQQIAQKMMEALEAGRECDDLCPADLFRVEEGIYHKEFLQQMRDYFCHWLFPALKEKRFAWGCGPCPCRCRYARDSTYGILNETQAEIIEKVRLLAIQGEVDEG